MPWYTLNVLTHSNTFLVQPQCINTLLAHSNASVHANCLGTFKMSWDTQCLITLKCLGTFQMSWHFQMSWDTQICWYTQMPWYIPDALAHQMSWYIPNVLTHSNVLAHSYTSSYSNVLVHSNVVVYPTCLGTLIKSGHISNVLVHPKYFSTQLFVHHKQGSPH